MINFVSKRRWFFVAPIIVIIAGLIGLLVNGLELDIQFQGGTVLQIQMKDENFNSSDIEADLGSMLNKTITAQKLQAYNPETDADDINLLMLKVSKDNALNEGEINQIISFIKENYGLDENVQMQIENVDPVIGREMLNNSLRALLIASALIVLYVWWRFSVMGLPAAVTALLALMHDVAIMASVHFIVALPVNEAFIASVLTIIGYSLNNTIVVYDRIRENSRLMGRAQNEELINRSINQSLTRTINTSITTILCVIILYIFASANNIQILRDFSLSLAVGFLAGTYSSICIASPLWMMWRNAQRKKRMKVKKA